MADGKERLQLTRALASRHIFMLSLGGVIGTGLFMGSGVTINQGGPAGAVLAYLVAGVLMYLVMVCLGELSVQMPVSGSFQAHATRFIGPATGFMIGWVYWMSWASTVGLEFTAAGMLMTRWFPEVPVWLWSGFFVVVLFSLNALATRAFGEAEYWFAGIKVAAILVFIVVGGLVIFGGIELKSGAPAPMFSNLVGERLFPNGLSAVFAVMMTVVYAFQGCEIMGVAAGETERPEKSIPRAVRNVVFRVLIFYVLAIVVLSAIIPWQQAGLMESPFVQVFDMVGIPYAADLMNFVILTAILSVGNSGLYASTRILWAMSRTGMAPRGLSKLSARGVPLYALLITLCFALLSLLTSVVAADTLFMVLMAVSGMSGNRHLDRHRLRPIPLPPRAHGQRRHGRRAEICRAAVPAGAAGLHRRVLLAVRLPRPRSHPAAVLVLGLRLHRRLLPGLLRGSSPAAAGTGRPRPGTGRLNGHPQDPTPAASGGRFRFRLVGLFEVVTAGSRGPPPLFGGSHGVWLCACRRAVTYTRMGGLWSC